MGRSRRRPTRRAYARGLWVLLSVVLGASVIRGPVPADAASSGATPIWVHRYGGTFFNLAHAIATSPDGSTIFVAGTGYLRRSDYDFVTIAYDARTGVRRWIDRYDGPAGAEDYVDSIVASPDGSRVFVTGTSFGSRSDDVATIAYRVSTGERIWVRRRGPAGVQDFARGLTVSPDGARVFITATTERAASRSDVVTAAYRASTGRELWSERYEGPGDSSDYAQSLAVSPDGTAVFVSTLSSSVGGGMTHTLLAYDVGSGASRWIRADTGSLRFTMESPLQIAVDPDGSEVFVSGTARGRDRGTDFGTVAYDPGSGVRVWARRYAGAPNGYDFANALAVSADGSTVVVAGGSPSRRSATDYATVAYRADTGATRWSKRYDGPAAENDVANALALSRDGTRVYVTGESAGRGTSGDCATVAYSTRNGARIWSARYDGASSEWDFALAVAVSPSGARVFVTGGSERGGDDFFVTIAYRG
jgi:sugar lactone lactonase YvrE